MKRVMVGAGFLFLAFAGVAVIWVLRTSWTPQADFDVLGIMWLLMNLPKLMAFVLALLFAFIGVYLLVKARKLRSLGAADEEARILQDPRFYGILAHRSNPPQPTDSDHPTADA